MLQNHVQLKYGVWLPDYSNNVEATGNIVEATFDFVEATFDFVATNGNNIVERFYCKILYFRQCRMLLRHCCRFWQQCCRFRQECRTKFRPFDNVEATFDTVERIVQLVAFDNVASTSLLVWTGLNYLGRPLTFCTFSYNLDLQFITTL